MSPYLKFQNQILIQCYTLHMKHPCMQLDVLCTDHVLPGVLHTTSIRDMLLHPKVTTEICIIRKHK